MTFIGTILYAKYAYDYYPYYIWYNDNWFHVEHAGQFSIYHTACSVLVLVIISFE